MDGVVVNSTAMHVEAWRVYLQRHGLEAENLADRMLGRHNDELVRAFFPPDGLTAEVIDRHGAHKESVYRELMSPVLQEKLVPGVRDFIVRHRDEALGIATNAEPANVDFVLDSAGLRSYFQAIVNGGQVSRPKPFPDIYLRVADMLGYAPEDCVVFEDSMTGVEAARAAGARVVGVSTTLSRFNNVDITVQDFLDPRLEAWLEELTVSR
jgi:beta-phosphoglucomutase